MAVLGAAASLHRDDPLDLHLGPTPAHPHLVGQRERLSQAVVGQVQAPGDLVLAEAFALLQDLASCLIQDVVAHVGSSCRASATPRFWACARRDEAYACRGWACAC